MNNDYAVRSLCAILTVILTDFLIFLARQIETLKNSALSFIFLAGFLGCKKENNQHCLLVSTHSSGNGNTQISLLTYDSLERIKSISTGGQGVVSYTYFKDSVVEQNLGQHKVYYLNPSDLATSSRTTFNPNPNGVQLDDSYTYNGEGYLVDQQEIFTQLYNGNILKDTVIYHYTIQGGNVVKLQGTNTEDLIIEYGSDLATSPFINYLFINEALPFLGKPSTNLAIRTKNNYGGVNSSISYGRDSRGNVILRTNSNANGSFTTSYSYQCN